MRRFFYPNKDASIYEEFPSRQAGLDEVLEIGKSDRGLYKVRSLISFDMATISASVANGTLSPTSQFELKLFLARADKIQLNQTVNVHPISASWSEGSGYFYQDMRESTDGVTWKNRETASLWVASGSDYITSISSSTTTDEPIGDLAFNVTSIVSSWISGNVPNNGFLAKFNNGAENDGTNWGNIKVFSRNTHTVFSPVLIAKWDNSVYSTGSWTAASSDALTVYPVNLRPEYKQGEVSRIDLVARELYPMKTFTTQFESWKSHYLPATSYYSVVDVQSQEVIIPFDDNSKISIDSGGNYIILAIDKMFPRRYYRLLFKVIFSDGHQYIFDEHDNFTVIL